LNSRIHAVGDGAEWIQLQTREVFGEQATFLCDFFHVSEYLGEAATICRPTQPHQWRRTQQKRLRRGEVQKVIAALEEHLESVGTSDEEAPVRNGHRYLNNRRECLDYPRALKLGLPIGSGMIESGHRHVLQASNCHFEVWHRPPGEAAAARAGMRLLTSQLGPGWTRGRPVWAGQARVDAADRGVWAHCSWLERWAQGPLA
jgi:hypothetical protein